MPLVTINGIEPGAIFFCGDDRPHISIKYCLYYPDSSVGKESACNAGDPSSVPGLGRSAAEGISYLLQYSWASLVAQLVKNAPAMQETWV